VDGTRLIGLPFQPAALRQRESGSLKRRHAGSLELRSAPGLRGSDIVFRFGTFQRIESRRLDAAAFGHADEAGQCPDTQLCSDPTSMKLDGFLDGAEISGNLLVQPPGDDPFQHLVLPGSQAGEPPSDRLPLGIRMAGEMIDLDGVADRSQQILRPLASPARFNTLLTPGVRRSWLVLGI
jgi:hypothetical protein